MENNTNRKEAYRYDHVAYPSHAYPETNPDLLAAIGTLFGMSPPEVRGCRVLEIGCGDGSNLIPLALSLPQSEFLGIDFAQQPIQRAQAVIHHTSLNNVTVQVMDLLDFPAQLGKFDYIIAHGFYSWVPAALQHKLLQVCDEHLTQQGIAFVSYNTYPAGRWTPHLLSSKKGFRMGSRPSSDALRSRVRQPRSPCSFLRGAPRRCVVARARV